MLEMESNFLHENIVQYLYTERDHQFKYVVMMFCDATLQDYVEDKGGIRSRLQTPAKDIMYQAIKGLHYLHRLNIVHRDIKPQDILLVFTDVNKSEVSVKICDFGLSIKLDSETSSFPSNFCHSVKKGWTAPEILRGNIGVSLNSYQDLMNEMEWNFNFIEINPFRQKQLTFSQLAVYCIMC